jgi:peptidoglycan hydrolase-like protein with peptidoglycan-binding domain
LRNRPHRGRLRAAYAAAALSISFAVPAAAQAQFGDAPLRSGASGHDVRVLQSWLTHLGFTTHVDGAFGRGTTRSVRRYERKYRLRLDGVVSRGQIRHMRRQLGQAGGVKEKVQVQAPTGKATLSPDGRTAIAPADAPETVKAVIRAANRITQEPYKYGGGHASFADNGYDCSGAVSYALNGGGLIKRPMDSGELMGYGQAGAGTWITVYAHGGHAYIVIAGLRFDTSGSGEKGPRWRSERRAGSGYTVRHPQGL